MVELEEHINGCREGGAYVSRVGLAVCLTFNLQGLTEFRSVRLMPSNPVHMLWCKIAKVLLQSLVGLN